MSKATFVFIVGPTATGKTELALQVAEEVHWPILNCDSVQINRKINVGSAKPNTEELQRATHYLFDYVEPPNTLTAADYLKDVEQVIEKQQITNGIFVGGSGFYVQALQKGLFPNSEPSEEVVSEVEAMWEKGGAEALMKWLQEKDPQAATRISTNDHYRLKRAVTVLKSQNLSLADLQDQMNQESHSPLPPHNAIKVGLNAERSMLRPRVEARTRAMLAKGWIEEVEALRAQGLNHWAPLNSVGYKEVQLFLDGEIKREDLQERILTATMQLIKKQQTWFKRDKEIQWFNPDQVKEAKKWTCSIISKF